MKKKKKEYHTLESSKGSLISLSFFLCVILVSLPRLFIYLRHAFRSFVSFIHRRVKTNRVLLPKVAHVSNNSSRNYRSHAVHNTPARYSSHSLISGDLSRINDSSSREWRATEEFRPASRILCILRRKAIMGLNGADCQRGSFSAERAVAHIGGLDNGRFGSHAARVCVRLWGSACAWTLLDRIPYVFPRTAVRRWKVELRILIPRNIGMTIIREINNNCARII